MYQPFGRVQRAVEIGEVRTPTGSIGDFVRHRAKATATRVDEGRCIESVVMLSTCGGHPFFFCLSLLL